MAPTDRLRRSVLAGILTLGLVTGVQELHGQGPWRGYPPGTIEAHRAGIFSAEPRSWEGAARLLVPMGARAVGMGRAVTAFQGYESAFWNPAGLAGIENSRLGIFRRNDIVGKATAFSLILARQPLGTLTFSYQFLDLGDQDFVDAHQNVLGKMALPEILSEKGPTFVAIQMERGDEGPISRSSKEEARYLQTSLAHCANIRALWTLAGRV